MEQEKHYMKHMCILRCETYARKPIETKEKLKQKSPNCIFVGYNS
jgi:hypothetical protein